MVEITIVALFTWLSGILLLVFNRDLYRILEGYGKFNPFRVFKFIEKNRYLALERKISKLEIKYKELRELRNQPEVEAKLLGILNALAELKQKKVVRFPDNEAWLLPTAFGNTMRAFEVYSRVMYGLDAIPGWERLLTVIPKDYRTLIDDAKAQTDFWINIWFLSLLLASEYIIVLFLTQKLILVWVFSAAILSALFAAYRARMAAVEWGHYIKASFDVFLPELYKKLGFQHPLNRAEERSNLVRFSQAIIYRSEVSLHDRALPESKENKPKENEEDKPED
ncbi:hypothetical protein [Chroococcidiopsis cubana]|uniref:hypothetical protein n=1 Tax=Chroococcidiopsis cubana TaxID=171392 RepID=UPI000F8D7C08|nr:hypothetical protein [Chroococcidiopsis cubana]